jgi:NarL family two-component system response regulator LiaR
MEMVRNDHKNRDKMTMSSGIENHYFNSMSLIKVFIFEDEWMVREALESIIEKSDSGLEFIGDADNVEQGVKTALEVKPDVVLMDLRLKGQMNGIEAMRIILNKQPDIKIIVFTSFPDEKTLHESVDLGAQGYLLKQEVTDPSIIINAIHEVHAGHSYLTPSMTAKMLNIVRKSKAVNDYNLTDREKEVLSLISEGNANKQIAGILEIDERTVANHISHILDKMGAKNRTDAVIRAREEGIIK